MPQATIMALRSWAILLTLAALSAAVLVSFLINPDYQKLFCTSFSDSEELPFNKDSCALLEKVHVCRGRIADNDTLFCDVY